MTINWIALTNTPFELAVEDIETPWLMVIEAFEDFDHLSITAEGKWSAYPGLPLDSGPDGYASSPIAVEQRFISDCHLGALIGKLGGSTAMLDLPNGEGADIGAFAIGSHAMVKVPAGCFGPLFIGFNVKARPITVEKLSITVRGAKLISTAA